ncbi:MAG: phosphatidate cytidylyltransferase [Bacteroidales bacterium]|nr:phosphatidate cytidylyltransferase [Bacteroidales bacterium]
MEIKKLLLRSVSGLIYVALITLGCVYGYIGVPLLGAVLAVLATVEFAGMCRDHGAATMPMLIIDTTMTVCLALGCYVLPLFVWLCLLICRLVLELYTADSHPLLSLGRSLMTQVYIGVPLFLMSLLPSVIPYFAPELAESPMVETLPYGILYDWPMLLVVFFMIWINDTGAFVVGSLLGRHRLFERISPKKSWEGFFGGLLFNLIAGTLFCYFGGRLFSMHGQLLFWCILGTVVTVFATWGDLVESLIKRSLGLKDSGHLIPGHGGILDRIDSLLLVIPAVFIYYIVWVCGYVWKVGHIL